MTNTILHLQRNRDLKCENEYGNIPTAIKDVYTAVTPPAHIRTEDASVKTQKT